VLETVLRRRESNCKRLGCEQQNFSSVWHTGLSGGASDSVRCARLVRGELAALGIRRRRTAIIHRTVRWCTGMSGGAPECPVSQRSPAQRSAAQFTGDAWPATTVGWAHRTVQCAPDSVRCANRPRGPTVGCA
jgi:hypothetical protein